MFSEKILQFLNELEFTGSLPAGISIMNPYREIEISGVVREFYLKYYNDEDPRYIILGINPGRNGAGVTGIPFTDSKRLKEKCGLSLPHLNTFETSSVFIYEMIEAFGGPELFYHKFFISAVCPLGFTADGRNGKQVNYNYYDSPALLKTMKGFIIENLKKQLDMGIMREVCFCLGTGKNFRFLDELNREMKFFGKVIPLEHPRFIMQYKLKKKSDYIRKYLEMFEIKQLT